MVVNSTTDIVNALVAKGVLTEEEGALISKGHDGEAAGQAKAMKKASKLKVSDAIDNATIYGDVRVRYEDRQGDGVVAANTTGSEHRQRDRYKVTLGVKTTSGDWYTDLALAMGANGRSDNATFGSFGSAGGGNALNNKETLYIKRAMVGYKATDWLTLEAGRMDNPLYTTSMVWDADLTFEGLVEKLNYKVNDNLSVFANLAQMQYLGDKKSFLDGGATSSVTNELLAFQGGAKYAFNDKTSAKIALTDYYYTHGRQGITSGVNGYTPGAGTGIFGSNYYVNDLDVIEIPAEVNYMASSNIGIRVFGDYAWNTSADDRAVHSGISGVTGSSGSDDSAWMLGVMVGSAKDLKSFEGNKMVAGDWSARLWYQEVGVWALDQNAVDSDLFDSRVNMKGTSFKAQYNIKDNVIANFTAAHADRKNDAFGTPTGAGNDLALNLQKFDLIQLDLTYKF